MKDHPVMFPTLVTGIVCLVVFFVVTAWAVLDRGLPFMTTFTVLARMWWLYVLAVGVSALAFGAAAGADALDQRVERWRARRRRQREIDAHPGPADD